jgi:UDP-glucose 4-epimerase
VPTAIPITETHATDPICSYGIVKLLIEKYLLLNCRENGLPFMSLRIANPFGPRQAAHSGQGAVAAFLRKALLGQEIEIWGDGTVVRDYIYISDVVDAFLLAIDFDGSERVMNIGSGVGLSINDLLICIEAVVNHPIRRRYLGRRSFDVPINVLDVSRARNLLGWAPKIDFRSGAQLSADWIQQHEII